MDGAGIAAGKRNYGIDLLRIICMIMIIILHIFGQMFGKLEFSSLGYAGAWLAETTAYCAVNCFALISGYVGCEAKFKYANLLYLCIQVFFYTMSITLIFLILKPDAVSLKTIIKAVFPFAYDAYWYFTSYFCMYVFIPFLNRLLEQADKQVVFRLLITMFCAFSLLPTVFHYDMAKINGGYSTLWLIFMYLTGAYIKKYVSIRRRICLGGYFFCVFFSWVAKIGIEFITNLVMGEPKWGNYFIEYTSPTIVLCGIFLLAFFSKLQMRDKWHKLIAFFAPASFGVYLIHNEEQIAAYFFEGRFDYYLDFHPIVMILMVLCTALIIWFVCSIIDRVRIFLFDCLGIREKCDFFEEWLFHKIEKGMVTGRNKKCWFRLVNEMKK